jgi:hypothetical protein
MAFLHFLLQEKIPTRSRDILVLFSTLMARGLGVGVRVADKRVRFASREGLILGTSGENRSRKWKVRWENGPEELVSARSLQRVSLGAAAASEVVVVSASVSGTSDAQLENVEDAPALSLGNSGSSSDEDWEDISSSSEAGGAGESAPEDPEEG